MSVINMAKNIKQVHRDSIICYKVGTFYNCYGKDSYILSYLFNYKIKTIEHDIPVCGFQKSVLPRVSSRFQKEKINYIIIDTKNNYDIDEKEEFGNLNMYNEKLNKSKEKIKVKLRVEKISKILLEKNNIELIRKIEKIVNENRKIQNNSVY